MLLKYRLKFIFVGKHIPMIEYIFQIALIIVPAGAVLFTAKTFLDKQSQKEVVNLNLELKKQRQEYFLPTRVEAYQRLILLMERISPKSLIVRTHQSHFTALQFQGELLQAIRQEFEHNVTQQLFVSPQAWKLAQDAKEETIRILNLAAKQMDENASGMDLSTKLFEIVAEVEVLPTDIAVDFIKKEFQELL